MKKKFSFLTAFLLIALNLSAGDYQNQIRSTQDRSKAVFRIEKSTGAIQELTELNIPVSSGYLSGATAAVITFSSTPGFEASTASGALCIDWADGELIPVTYSFMVPTNYNSGGTVTFEALSESSGIMTTSTKLAIALKVNGGTITASSSIAVTSGSYEAVSIDASSLATLAAGDEVSIVTVRADDLSGTGTLQIKGIVFKYNNSMDLQ